MRPGLTSFSGEFCMYETNDLYLAAAAQEAGHKLQDVFRQGTRALFVFEDGADLRRTITEYFSGDLMVRAHSFAEKIRSAKSMAMNAQPSVRE